MNDIDVEPVEDVDDATDDDAPESSGASDDAVTVEDATAPVGVDAPEYVLYGGKGGVGKTTMAAATGLASARDGVATLVVSTDPAHSLSDTLEYDIPADPARIREDIPLYAAEIDPDEALEEGPFAGEGGGMGGMGGAMGGLGDAMGEEMVDPLGGSMPGADEAAAVRLLIEYVDDPRFDRVVVDTAPTGHTLRLLELPELMDSMLGRIARMRQRFSGMMDNLKGMFGGGPDDPQAGMADLDDLRERIERLRAVLRDPTRTDFRVVMIPEEMSVVESKRLVSRLDEFGIPVQTLVVNRVMESVEDVANVDPEWIESPDLENCGFCQRRWQVQQDALRSATNLFRGRDVKRVPLLAEQVQGEDALRVVATCLD